MGVHSRYQMETNGSDAMDFSNQGLIPGNGFTAGEFEVFVLLWTAKMIKLQVKKLDTIDDVKDKIRRSERIPKDRQVLRFDGQDLDDSKTLEYYSIQKGSTLNQLFKRYMSIRSGRV